MSEITRSWAATAASSAAALFTSKETAVVLGRSAARVSAEVSVRQAVWDSATKPHEKMMLHTNGEFVGWVPDDVLGARACNKSATKEKDLLLGLGLEELRLAAENGSDIFALDQQAAREFGQVES